MKLGVVTASFPRFAGDAAGHFVASHVELLRRAGHSVEVIAAGDGRAPARERRAAGQVGLAATPLHGASDAAPDARSTEATSARALAPLEITRIPSELFFTGGAPEALARNRSSALAAAGFTARLTAAVARASRGWDATVAHWLAPSALAALLAPGPLLAIAHGGDVPLLRRAGLLAPTLAALLARRARLAFVSEELAALARAALPAPLRRRFDEATLVQPMGVDVAHFAAASSRHARPHPRRYLLVLARLVPVKGIDLALAAFAALDDGEGGDRLDLVIAGDGPERLRLERLAASLPAAIASRVHFLGELAAPARDAWLAHATAVLLPSRRLPDGRTEGTPQVALETLAAGVPLLASATGGLATLPSPAHLLPELERAPHRWAAALRDLLTTPPATTALRAAAAPFDWPRVTASLSTHWLRRHRPAPLRG